MNKQNIALALAVIAIVIAIIGIATRPAALPQGVTNYDELSLKATYGTTTLGVYGNTTTSGGCIEMNATSSQTKINLRFSPLGATSTFSGTAYWQYGTCK